MNKLCPILACALVVCAPLKSADCKNVNKTVSLNPKGSVRLETFKGSIRISTWDRPDVDIQARIEAGASTSRGRFDATEVAIDSTPDSVTVQTKLPCCISDAGSNPLVHYTIQMPRTAKLRIRDHASDAEIAGLSGALEIETHRGDFHVDFTALTGDSRVETHRGSVELLLPRDSKFDIRTDLDRRASLESDFPVMARLAHHRGRNLEGSVNGGGPILELHTYRGSIRLRAK